MSNVKTRAARLAAVFDCALTLTAAEARLPRPRPTAGHLIHRKNTERRERMKAFRLRGVTAVLVAIAAIAGLTLTSSAAASAATVKVKAPVATVKAAAPAASIKLAPDNISCSGTIEATNSALGAQQAFWWYQYNASAVCIGSVIFTVASCCREGLAQRVRIWGEPDNVLLDTYYGTGSPSGNNEIFDTVARQVEPATEVMVCSALTVGDTNNLESGYPTVCTTVG